MSIRIPGMKLDERDLHLLPYTKEVNEFIIDTYRIISKYSSKRNAFKYVVFNAAGYTINSPKYDFKVCAFSTVDITLFMNTVKHTNNVYLKEFYLKIQSMLDTVTKYTTMEFKEIFTMQDEYGKSIVYIDEVFLCMDIFIRGIKALDFKQYYQPIISLDENYVPYDPVSAIILSY